MVGIGILCAEQQQHGIEAGVTNLNGKSKRWNCSEEPISVKEAVSVEGTVGVPDVATHKIGSSATAGHLPWALSFLVGTAKRRSIHSQVGTISNTQIQALMMSVSTHVLGV